MTRRPMTRQVRITHLDGKLPNLALMRLSHWHKSRGDCVYFTRSPVRELDEPADYDVVYGAAIFKFSADRVQRFRNNFQNAICGGTGTDNLQTVESIIGANADYPHLDYSLYPEYKPSIGFTQRGCRLKCKFCVVPQKEGKNRQSLTIAEIWRGDRHPKHLHLLDNDFFGNPEWRDRAEEIIGGKFRVCLNQGINVRLINEDAAATLARMEYRDDGFKRRRLYTAWDNIGDEDRFLRGVRLLNEAGIPYRHMMAYMLVGYHPRETWDGIMHRHETMVDLGILPYPMVYDCRGDDPEKYKKLKRFQRWTVTGLYRAAPFSEYTTKRSRSSDNQLDLFEAHP